MWRRDRDDAAQDDEGKGDAGMMKKSMILFAAAVVFAIGMTAYGWIFAWGQVGEAVLTEETTAGDREAAEGLVVGFRADSSDDLHWISSFDYSTGQTASSFQRGELAKTTVVSVYDDIRFNGWSAAPYVTRLEYSGLAGLQDKELHSFYDGIQRRVAESGEEETGRIKLRDYLDFYSVSFDFQLGSKIYNSENALTGLKVYEQRGRLSEESGTAYDEDVDLYTALNEFFKIPVIGNEYQEYRVVKAERDDDKTSLGYETEIRKPLGEGEDFYEFDPILVVQEENILDGKKWSHPDLSGGMPYEAGGDEADGGTEASETADSGSTTGDADNEADSGAPDSGTDVGVAEDSGSAAGDAEAGGESDAPEARKKASDYNLKNRILFIVNNRTAKGASVDLSQISGGYGVYELPIDVIATATVTKGSRSKTVPNPKPAVDEMKMVYSLDEEAEYVEMSLSADHRYLAVFSVKDGQCFVDMVDADTWTSGGPMEVFPASENMTYAWGEDGTLALTNHQGHIAVLTRAEDGERPYEILYSGEAENGLDQALFDAATASKENSYAKYQCSADAGLAIAAKDGKAALVQNLLTGGSKLSYRSPAMECVIIDSSGVIYRGRVKSNITDLDYDMSEEELQAVSGLLSGAAGGGTDGRAASEANGETDEEAADSGRNSKPASEAARYIIQPVRTENWCRWETAAGT